MEFSTRRILFCVLIFGGGKNVRKIGTGRKTNGGFLLRRPHESALNHLQQIVNIIFYTRNEFLLETLAEFLLLRLLSFRSFR